MNKITTVIFAVFVLLLSGCGGVQDGYPPVGTPDTAGNSITTANRTTGTERTVVEEHDDPIDDRTLSVNADAVFTNVLALTGVDARQPTIQIVNQTSNAGNSVSDFFVGDFGEVLGLRPTTDTSTTDRPGGYTVKGTVFVLPRNASDPELKRLLAHEFAHVLEYQRDWQSYLYKSDVAADANRRPLSRCLSEGVATYVADEYVRRYSVDVRSDMALMHEQYVESTGVRKYFYAPYYFCARYVHSRLGSPKNVTEVYLNPPVTTEQVIHNYTPSEELPENLDVTVDETNTSWNLWTESTKGELFTRVVFANVISEQGASRAAAGWGNDRLLEFHRDGRKSFVWILRWDTTNDSEQFARSFERYLEARNVGTDGCLASTCFERRPLGPKTSAILVGPRSFLSNVTVERTNASVIVSPP